MKTSELIKSSVLAGICISFGGVAFLSVGGLGGAVLFTFGLLAVVHYKLKLFTGTAGFVQNMQDMKDLGIILAGNIVGCLLVALAIHCAKPQLVGTASEIMLARLGNSYIQNILLGIGCGFVMTTAVQFGREGRFLPLLFGVPLFIMCGFLHSIADAFYYCAASVSVSLADFWNTLWTYLSIVLGNFIGCNLYRIIMMKKEPI